MWICNAGAELLQQVVYLWLYSPLLGLGRNLYTVGRTLWTGDQPVARSLPTHRINAHRHPCLEWDSKARSQRSSRRRQFMPLWSACRKLNLHKPAGTLRVGKSTIRWLHSVEDLKRMCLRNWRRKSLDGDQWRSVVKAAEVHMHCSTSSSSNNTRWIISYVTISCIHIGDYDVSDEPAVSISEPQNHWYPPTCILYMAFPSSSSQRIRGDAMLLYVRHSCCSVTNVRVHCRNLERVEFVNWAGWVCLWLYRAIGFGMKVTFLR
jgi:hypothetical protein